MRKRVTKAIWLTILLLLTLVSPAAAVALSMAESRIASRLPQAISRPAVTLRAASGATIPFWIQNGDTVENVPPREFILPHLVLYRNGTLTQAGERTLILEVAGIEVPAPGVTVTLEVETQHEDPDFDINASQRILVWRESRWTAPPPVASQKGITALFELEFGATVDSGGARSPTPTDYFRYRVTVTGANHPPANPLYASSGDYAFLMESQWVARLPEVRESSPGAAPDELIVYYADMFPFRQDTEDPTTWLPREEVTAYVGAELLSQMVEAFRMQTDEWGYPWHDAWTSHRAQDAQRLSVALGDGRTWFHGWAPRRGHAGISLSVSSRGHADYDTLTDGLMSAFHHELFHNLQRNLNLHLGGDGRVSGEKDAWQFYSEGTATLASSIGQTGIQFAPGRHMRTYMRHANRFLRRDSGRFQDLVVGQREDDPYSAAVYWRFLYEQCGGMHDGVEDPAAGMQIIRRALIVLYSGEIVDISSSADLAAATPEVLDRALAGSSCPFQTYRESLTAFARAVYALRLDGGQCTEPGIPAGCGFYDPYSRYRTAHVRAIPFDGTAQEYRHKAMNGFDIALVDIVLDPAADRQPLTIELSHPPAAGPEFDVQILHLADSVEGGKPQHVMAQVVDVEVPVDGNAEERPVYAIPAIDRAAYNRLGLIITRLDAQETSDPAGEYTIVLRPSIDPLTEAAGALAYGPQS